MNPRNPEHDGAIVILFALAGVALLCGIVGYVFLKVVCGA